MLIFFNYFQFYCDQGYAYFQIVIYHQQKSENYMTADAVWKCNVNFKGSSFEDLRIPSSLVMGVPVSFPFLLLKSNGRDKLVALG